MIQNSISQGAHYESTYNSEIPKVDMKVEKILEGSQDSIPSPLPSVKIQIIGGKVYLR